MVYIAVAVSLISIAIAVRAYIRSGHAIRQARTIANESLQSRVLALRSEAHAKIARLEATCQSVISVVEKFDRRFDSGQTIPGPLAETAAQIRQRIQEWEPTVREAIAGLSKMQQQLQDLSGVGSDDLLATEERLREIIGAVDRQLEYSEMARRVVGSVE